MSPHTDTRTSPSTYQFNPNDASKMKGNYFSPNETLALHTHFASIANFTNHTLTLYPLSEYTLSDEDLRILENEHNVTDASSTSSFRIMFPYFEKEPEIEKPFFAAFTSPNKTYISFSKYLRFMSIVTNGSPVERLELALKLIVGNDTEKDVKKADFIVKANRIAKCLEDAGHQTDFEAEVVADHLFCFEVKQQKDPEAKKSVDDRMETLTKELYSKGDSNADDNEQKKRLSLSQDEYQNILEQRENAYRFVDSLPYNIFMKHARKFSSLATSFGLFTVIYTFHLKPLLAGVEETMSVALQQTNQLLLGSMPREPRIDEDDDVPESPVTITAYRFPDVPEVPSLKTRKRQLLADYRVLSASTLRNVQIKHRDDKPRLSFSSGKAPLGINFEDDDRQIPHFEGSLFTKKWDTRRSVNMWAKVCNGFILFYDKSRDKEDRGKPWQILVLHEACAQPVSNDDKKANEFLLTVRAENGKKMSRVFVADGPELRDEWIDVISKSAVANYPHPNRFYSFAPVHSNVGARFFTSGEEYFGDLARNLKAAKHHIFITDWHLTADLYLTRNPKGDQLDTILKERADAGVKVYVAIWKDFMNLASDKAEKVLQHNNIFVIRDPKCFHVWTQHQKMVTIDGAIGYFGGMDIAIGRFDTHEYRLLDEDEKYFPGLDYSNPMAGYDKFGDPIDSTAGQDRVHVPRMPWHDLHCKVVGAPVMDLERNFIQRWEVSRPHADTQASRDRMIIPLSEPQEPAIPQDDITHNKCRVQMLRSVGSWSFNFKQTECSMYVAQLKAIRYSRNFIYIANQFFVTSSDPRLDNPRNLILRELLDRIERAHKENHDFRIIMLHPQQPCSAITQNMIARTMMYWQYGTLGREEWSFWKELESRVGKENVDRYVCVSSLRNWEKSKVEEGLCLTELVYVHAKMMIVDDDVAFISSQNINDRSMLGSRDSEIGAVIEDPEDLVDIKMSGQTERVGRFAHELRMQIFRVLLGLNANKSEDHLISDPFDAFNMWAQQGSTNQMIYVDVFKYVHASVHNLKELLYITNYDLTRRPHVVRTKEEYEQLLKVKGFVVSFPREFLRDSWYKPSIGPHVDALVV